jgi:hypothetical protein
VLGNPAIDALRKVLHGYSSKGRLSDYRNYNTHGVLTQREIEDAINAFLDHHLWGKTVCTEGKTPGTAFIGLKWARDVINSLLPTPIEPAEIYRKLINQLATRLKNPSYEFAV